MDGYDIWVYHPWDGNLFPSGWGELVVKEFASTLPGVPIYFFARLESA